MGSSSFRQSTAVFPTTGVASSCAGPLGSLMARAPTFASISLRSEGPIRGPLFVLADARTATPAVPVDKGHYKAFKVAPDGKCMFRSLVQGMARNKGLYVGPRDEEREADELRQAVYDAICRTDKRRSEFKEAVEAVKAEDTIGHYCHRLLDPKFWGGTPELLVLSKMLRVPIYVFIPPEESKYGGTKYYELARFGEQHAKKRKPVRLLYSNGNHYDLLLAR